MSKIRLCVVVTISALALLLSGVSMAVADALTGQGSPSPMMLGLSPEHARVSGELLVKWRQPATRSDNWSAIIRLTSSLDARITRDLPRLGLSRVSMSEARRDRVVAALTESPLVEWVEPNYVIELDVVPDDPYYVPYQWPYLANMEMEAAWDITQGDPSIVVAVIDTGIDFGHTDLAGAFWQNSGEMPGNDLDDDGNGYVDDVQGWDFFGDDNDPSDEHGHGTHVSGIVAARTGNSLGMAGIAGQATIMPLGIFHPDGFGTYADLIEAIVYATDNGARVINMSLGAVSYSLGEEAAVNYAWDHGVILFGAAGNEANDAMHYPSAHEHVVGVSSVNHNDTRSSFSSYGDFVALSAPGSSILSTIRGSGYGWMSGTSMATPQVSGLAALILARNPTLTNAEVRSILETTVDDLGDPGWDRYFGYGRVNGRKALEATWEPEPPLPPPPTPPEPKPMFPAYCQELVSNGNFERGDLLSWNLTGEAALDTDTVFRGDHSLLLTHTSSGSGEARQVIGIPSDSTEATLYFAIRILSDDPDFGSDPNDPFDDRIEVSFRDAGGEQIMSLLRAGNTSDGAPGLPWDEYLYRIPQADLETLKQQTPVQLHFEASNNDDAQTTSFHVDLVRFCVARAGYEPRIFLPVMLRGSRSAYQLD